MKRKKALDKIFGSNARVDILGYLFFDEKESYLRELAKKLKISPSAVKREIENLEALGILKKKNNRITLNESSVILNELRSIFMKTDFIIYPIKKSLDSNKIKFAFVFGSFARGDYVKESDVDVMIIGDIKLKEVISLTSLPEKKIGRDINPVVWSVENLKKEKNSGFVRDVFRKGIIMIKGDESELRKIVK